LDSAYPLFANEGPDGRLDAGDAILVDAIHTASGFLGLREPYAQVDFYPNRGTVPQPGCDANDIVGEYGLTYTCPCTGPQDGAEDERQIVNRNTLAWAVGRRNFTADSRARS